MSYSVDYDALADHGTQLGGLRDEFNGVENNIGSYDWAMGHGGVCDKLGDFASNWSDKRKEMADRLDGVAQCASGAAEGYCETDTGIAGNINGASA